MGNRHETQAGEHGDGFEYLRDRTDTLYFAHAGGNVIAQGMRSSV